MSAKLSNIIILSAVAILLAACAPTPIKDIENAPVNASSANYDLSDVTTAIKKAGVGLGWQMKEETPGHIVGGPVQEHASRRQSGSLELCEVCGVESGAREVG